MWIRNKSNILVKINKLDYLTDTDYYNAIIQQKFNCVIKQSNNSKDRIKDLIGYKMHESGLGFFDPRIATAANKRKKQNIEELQGQSIVNLNETSNSKL